MTACQRGASERRFGPSAEVQMAAIIAAELPDALSGAMEELSGDDAAA